MNSYEERKARRIERYEALAEKASGEAENRFKAASDAVSGIPFGQPILVGHHSEGRHRAALKRQDNNLRKSIELSKKAQYYEEKARAAETNNAISSDDPEALEKLKAKAEELEKLQAMMKEVNRVHALFMKGPDSEKTLKALEALPANWQEKIKHYTPRYSWEPHPCPPYALSNNSANLRRVKKRIQDLEAKNSMLPGETEVKGIRVVENVEENRLQLFFPGIPPEATRKALKSNGFRWSRFNGCWQRQLTNTARNSASYVLEHHYEV